MTAVFFILRSIVSLVLIYFLGTWMGGEWWSYVVSFFLVGGANLLVTNLARGGK